MCAFIEMPERMKESILAFQHLTHRHRRMRSVRMCLCVFCRFEVAFAIILRQRIGNGHSQTNRC